MPNTEIIQDGSQKYAIATPTFGSAGNNYIVESFTRTDSSSRVDLNDGEGLPLGAVVVPGRVEVSLTVQVGGEDDTSRPKAGDAITHNSETVVITEVALLRHKAITDATTSQDTSQLIQSPFHSLVKNFSHVESIRVFRRCSKTHRRSYTIREDLSHRESSQFAYRYTWV